MSKKQTNGWFKVRRDTAVADKIPRYLPYTTYTDQNLRTWSFVKLDLIKKIEADGSNLEYYYADKKEKIEAGSVKPHPIHGDRGVFGPLRKKELEVRIIVNKRADDLFKSKKELARFNDRVSKYLKNAKVEKKIKPKADSDVEEATGTFESDGESDYEDESEYEDEEEQNDTDELFRQMDDLKDSMNSCRADVGLLKASVSSVRDLATENQKDIKIFNSDVRTLQEENWEMKERLESLETLVRKLEQRVDNCTCSGKPVDVKPDHVLVCTTAEPPVDFADDVTRTTLDVTPNTTSDGDATKRSYKSGSEKSCASDNSDGFCVVATSPENGALSSAPSSEPMIDDFVDLKAEVLEQTNKMVALMQAKIDSGSPTLKAKMIALQKEMLKRLHDEIAAIEKDE